MKTGHCANCGREMWYGDAEIIDPNVKCYICSRVDRVFFQDAPQHVPFEVALAYLKAGRKIKRAAWSEGEYLYSANKADGAIKFATAMEQWSWGAAWIDILATDWCVLP